MFPAGEREEQRKVRRTIWRSRSAVSASAGSLAASAENLSISCLSLSMRLRRSDSDFLISRILSDKLSRSPSCARRTSCQSAYTPERRRRERGRHTSLSSLSLYWSASLRRALTFLSTLSCSFLHALTSPSSARMLSLNGRFFSSR